MKKGAHADRFCSTGEVAKTLRITPARVRQLIGDGKLLGTKVGRDLVVTTEDLATFRRGWKRYSRRQA